MAVRGTESKQKIKEKIFEVFPDAFIDGKLIRIPMEEDGEVVEIKVSLTAAKDVLGGGAAPRPVVTSSSPAPNPEVPFDECMNPPKDANWELTKQEEKQVAGILSKLGL